MDNDVSEAEATLASAASINNNTQNYHQLYSAATVEDQQSQLVPSVVDDQGSLQGESGKKVTLAAENRVQLVKERREQEKQRLLNELKMSEEKAEKVRRAKENERERKSRELRDREQSRRDHVVERRKQLEQLEIEKKRELLVRLAKEGGVGGTSPANGGGGGIIQTAVAESSVAHETNEFSSDTANSSPKYAQKKQQKIVSYAFGSSTPRGLTFLDSSKQKMSASGLCHPSMIGSRLGSAVASHLLSDQHYGDSSGRSSPAHQSQMTASVYVPSSTRRISSAAQARSRVQPLTKDDFQHLHLTMSTRCSMSSRYASATTNNKSNDITTQNSRTSEKNRSTQVLQKPKSKAQIDLMTKSMILPKTTSTTIDKAFSAKPPIKPTKPVSHVTTGKSPVSVPVPQKTAKPKPPVQPIPQIIQKLIPESELLTEMNDAVPAEEGKIDNDIVIPKQIFSPYVINSTDKLSPIADNENNSSTNDDSSMIVETGSLATRKSLDSDISSIKTDKIDVSTDRIENVNDEMFAQGIVDNTKKNIVVDESSKNDITTSKYIIGSDDDDNVSSGGRSEDGGGGGGGGAGAPSSASASSTNQKTLPKVMTADEAKTALAERRRLAREQMEREKEMERRREEEHRLAEEEEFRRQEEEELRLLREAREAEEQRLKTAVDQQRLKREEEEKRVQEEKQRLQELEMKNKEINEKLDREREEKTRQEELDRQERKKKLDAIRQRTRLVNADSVPSNLADQSASFNNSSAASSGSDQPTTLLPSSGSDKNLVKTTSSDTLFVKESTVSSVLSRVRSKINNGGSGHNLADPTHLTTISFTEQSQQRSSAVTDAIDQSLVSIATDNNDILTNKNDTPMQQDHLPNLHDLSISSMSYFTPNQQHTDKNIISHVTTSLISTSAIVSNNQQCVDDNIVPYQNNVKNFSTNLTSNNGGGDDYGGGNLLNFADDLNANKSVTENSQSQDILSNSQIVRTKTNSSSTPSKNEFGHFEINGEDMLNKNNVHNGPSAAEDSTFMDNQKNSTDFVHF